MSHALADGSVFIACSTSKLIGSLSPDLSQCEQEEPASFFFFF